MAVVALAVAAGMRALREIEALAVDNDDRPLQTVEILECGQLTEAESADFVSLQDARRKAHSKSRHGSSSGSGKAPGSSPAAADASPGPEGHEAGGKDAFVAWPDDPGPLYELDLPR
jgi:hypothetical protein